MESHFFDVFTIGDIVIWIVFLLVAVADLAIRWRFNLAYLGLMIPLRRREIPLSANALNLDLETDAIISMGEIKLRVDKSNSTIWIQPGKLKQMLLYGFVHKLKFSRSTKKISQISLGISLGSIGANALMVLLFNHMNAGPFGDRFAEAFGANFVFYFLSAGVVINLLIMARRSARMGSKALGTILAD